MTKIPPYSFQYSRKDSISINYYRYFSEKNSFDKGIRELIKFTGISKIVQEALGLTKTPHFSTLL